MTNNYVECFNNKTRLARTYLITTLLECIRFILQTRFYQRKEETLKHQTILAPLMEKDLQWHCERVNHLIFHPLSNSECIVIDGDEDGRVKLKDRTCSCRIFQVIQIMCSRAVNFARIKDVSV